MRVLLDTNIILDFLLVREPFFKDADNLFQAIASDRVEGYVTATTVTDIFYIVRKQTKSFELATKAVSTTLSALEVYPVNRNILEAALASNVRDFEDAVQLTCATFGSLEAIITRDRVGFAGTSTARRKSCIQKSKVKSVMNQGFWLFEMIALFMPCCTSLVILSVTELLEQLR